MLDVAGAIVPGIGRIGRYLDAAPAGIAFEHSGIGLLEHGWLDRGQGRLDFGLGRPDVAEKNRLARAVLAKRLLVEIDVHPTSQSKGHHQGRRSQIVGANLRVHSAFEVAVA